MAAIINLVVADKPTAAENLNAEWTHTDEETGNITDHELEVQQWTGSEMLNRWWWADLGYRRAGGTEEPS